MTGVGQHPAEVAADAACAHYRDSHNNILLKSAPDCDFQDNHLSPEWQPTAGTGSTTL
jgi:hypothetical protein